MSEPVSVPGASFCPVCGSALPDEDTDDVPETTSDRFDDDLTPPRGSSE